MGLFKKKKKDKDRDKDADGVQDAAGARNAGGQSPDTAGEGGVATPPGTDAAAADVLGLAPAAGKPAGQTGAPSRAGKKGPVDPEEGHRVALRASALLVGIARETRGLFEEVRSTAEVKAVWGFFTGGDARARKAVADGTLNPHAAASLIVYHLRDAAEPLCTSALRAGLLEASGLPSDTERLAKLRSLCSTLPEKNRELLASIGAMVAAVAAEHDACYKDGIDTRMAALGQLFGPLFLRPQTPGFDAEMAAAMRFAEDVFANPSLLSPSMVGDSTLSPVSANSSALPDDDDDSAAGVQLPQKRAASGEAAAAPARVPALKGLPQGSAAPVVPSLKGLPVGGGAHTDRTAAPPIYTSKAVTFRAALCEKGGGDYPPNRKPPPSPAVRSPGAAAIDQAQDHTAAPSAPGAGKASRPTSAPAHGRGGTDVPRGALADAAGGGVRNQDSDDETNYNLPATSDQWVEEVKALSDDERKKQLQAAMKGGPMVKYSSRGRSTALMFFRLSPDTDMLNWAPVATPENLKYGLVMDQVVRILPGPLASGQFQGASAKSKAELRMVIVLQEDQRLEVEALNSDALDMWAIALQHVVLARSPADPTMVSPRRPLPAGFGGGTHRNWGAPETARGPRPPGPVVNRLLLPSSGNHGDMTRRLLNDVGLNGVGAARGAAPGAQPASGFATSRAPRNAGGGWGTARNAAPRGPMTARGPGQADAVPNLVSLNAHVLLSKARHNRKSEMVALLDDASKELNVDVEDETGNSVLIIACQNNHKKIVKELLRRSCDVNHQNHKGHTCLHYCFAYKYAELGQYLISKGADSSLRNHFGLTCFEGLDVQRPATSLAAPQAWASPSADKAQGRRESDPADPQVEEELRALKRRMDQLEQENVLLKEGALTARAGGLTARRGELQDECLKGTAWPGRPATSVTAAATAPVVASPALRSSGSGTDNDETLGAEVAEVVQAIADEKRTVRAASQKPAAGKEDTDTGSDFSGSEGSDKKGAKQGGGTGLVGAARRAFERAAGAGDTGAAGLRRAVGVVGSRPPPSAPKPAVLAAAAEMQDGEEGSLTTPDCPTQNGDAGSMNRSSLFPLRTPVVEEAASTVQLGGRFEKPASSVTGREGKSSGSSVASKEGGRDAAPFAKVGKDGKENLASAGLQAKAAGAGSDKVPGTPKGNIKGKKPPAIATDAASADINHRSPLNLIRKWEKNGPASGDSAPAALAAKEVVQADAERDKSDQSQGKAGSSAEEESADAASASQPSTPCTPAGGYEAVLDSVRQEILQAEQIMSQVTCTFGVDSDASEDWCKGLETRLAEADTLSTLSRALNFPLTAASSSSTSPVSVKDGSEACSGEVASEGECRRPKVPILRLTSGKGNGNVTAYGVSWGANTERAADGVDFSTRAGAGAIPEDDVGVEGDSMEGFGRGTLALMNARELIKKVKDCDAGAGHSSARGGTAQSTPRSARGTPRAEIRTPRDMVNVLAGGQGLAAGDVKGLAGVKRFWGGVVLNILSPREGQGQGCEEGSVATDWRVPGTKGGQPVCPPPNPRRDLAARDGHAPSSQQLPQQLPSLAERGWFTTGEVDSETKQLGASKGLGATIRTDISDDEGSDEEDNQAQDSRAHATAHTADKPATSAAANKALSAKAVPAPEISVGSIHLMQGEHQGKALAAPAAAARKTDLASKSLSLKPVLAPVPVNAAASTGDKYKVSDSSKYGRGADVAKDHAKGSKLKPQNLQGSSIAFLGDARSGDWSDSMSEESDSEMLLLDRSSSGSDSGSAVALDEASDGGVLTLDALDRSKAAPLQVKTILGATISMPPEPTAPPAHAAAAGGTLGRVLAATQAYTQKDDTKGGDSSAAPASKVAPALPARKTAAKGKVMVGVYESGAAAAAAAQKGKGETRVAATPVKKPLRVAAGTGSAAKKASGTLATPSSVSRTNRNEKFRM